jgi:hypothetical protein
MAFDVGGTPVEPRVVAGSWPLAGRSRELQLLKEAIRARLGAVIVGPAGSGKSTLARAGVEFAQDQGMAVALVAGTEEAPPSDPGLKGTCSATTPGSSPRPPRGDRSSCWSTTRTFSTTGPRC